MKIGYARVSTGGQDLEVQLEALQAEHCDKVYAEKFTGAKVNRPEFQKALADLKSGDTLIVTKLDRLARNTEEGIKVIRELLDHDVKVQVLNMGMIDNTPMGRFIITVLLAVAEMERVMIIERMAEGKALAKKNPNFKEGRPKLYNKVRLDAAMELLETHSYKQVERVTGISESTLYREKKKRKALLQ